MKQFILIVAACLVLIPYTFAGGNAILNAEGVFTFVPDQNPEAVWQLNLENFDIPTQHLETFCLALSDNVFVFSLKGNTISFSPRTNVLPAHFQNWERQVQHLQEQKQAIKMLIDNLKL